ncbi:nuclear factor 7, ovary-like [Channa argus]|uniref:nuclear factor 7, ovary-like n=1 Tax=Channa argus TaxID=215402 RepID=UPI002944D2CE|nr:hypothetical protein Q8A73_014402 [Channa argus]
MASAFYSEDLTCSVCLTIFTDPVTLPCGHAFCRQCITDVLNTEAQCPQCHTAVPAEGKCLPTSHILKSLAEKAKEAEKIQKKHGHDNAEVAELCPEHEEKLKLFCITDQQLACIICRDGENHEGHKFKPVKEAAASLRKELETGMENLGDEILAAEGLANTQRDQITKTKKKSQQLMSQIHRQFEEMHQFLRKREDEIKEELKHKEQDAVEQMSEALKAMETALSEIRELDVKVKSVLEVKDPEKFLKSWTEGNKMMTAEHLFRPRARELQVVDTPLSMEPYESHLQFFTWKEMLQVIQPRAELLTLKSNSLDITVSDDGRSLICTPATLKPPTNPGIVGGGFSFGSAATFGQAPPPPFFSSNQPGVKNIFGRPSSGSVFGYAQMQEDTSCSSSSNRNEAFSVNEFSSGQHYWEIDVGHRQDWELGIKDHVLTYDGKKYCTRGLKLTTELALTDPPRKIGTYLNCLSQQLSFYEADNMTHIHTMSLDVKKLPVTAYFNVGYSASDSNPMTVCWY